MWELDYQGGWVQKNWCFWTVVLEKTLESPLDCKEIQPVHPKGEQSWVFIGRTDVEAETPILWPPDAKSWLIWKDPDTGKDWGQEEKGMTEDEMVGWHHRLNAHGFGWTPGVGDGQGGLACCDSWGCKESHMTDWTELKQMGIKLKSFWTAKKTINRKKDNLWNVGNGNISCHINKKCHSHQWFLASKCEWELPKLLPLLHSDWWGAGGMQDWRSTRDLD